MPVCRECLYHLQEKRGGPHLPPPALRNDNVFGLAPRILFDEKVTIAELILASPYKAGAMHFQVETVQGNVSVFDPAGKKAYRGNAVFFPLPMEALFAAAVASDTDGQPDEGGSSSSFHFSVEQLAETLTVTISGPGDGKKQAGGIVGVRRNVVRRLVEEMRDRQHPAYRALLDKDAWAAAIKAIDKLPLDGVPEILLTRAEENESPLGPVTSKKTQRSLRQAKAAVPDEPAQAGDEAVYFGRPLSVTGGTHIT